MRTSLTKIQLTGYTFFPTPTPNVLAAFVAGLLWLMIFLVGFCALFSLEVLKFTFSRLFLRKTLCPKYKLFETQTPDSDQVCGERPEHGEGVLSAGTQHYTSDSPGIVCRAVIVWRYVAGRRRTSLLASRSRVCGGKSSTSTDHHDHEEHCVDIADLPLVAERKMLEPHLRVRPPVTKNSS